MRVCPKCKFIDPPEWKHSKYSYHIDGITFENFKGLYPLLASNLRNGGDLTEDEDYVYRLVKTKRMVQRKAKIEWTEGRNPFGAEKYEKFAHNPPHSPFSGINKIEWGVWRRWNPNQTKLLETVKKEPST